MQIKDYLIDCFLLTIFHVHVYAFFDEGFWFADDGNDAVDVRSERQSQRTARPDDRARSRCRRQKQRKYSLDDNDKRNEKRIA